MNRYIKHHIVKNCILLCFTCALLATTPLSLAMNLEEQRFQKIDEFRQALFYIKNEYKKNKNKKLFRDNAKNLAIHLIHENEKHDYEDIRLQDIFLRKISHASDQENIYVSYYYLLESINGSESRWPLFLGLYEYYDFVASNKNISEKNRNEYLKNYQQLDSAPESVVLTQSLKNKLSLLLKQKASKINTNMLNLESNLNFIVSTFPGSTVLSIGFIFFAYYSINFWIMQHFPTFNAQNLKFSHLIMGGILLSSVLTLIEWQRLFNSSLLIDNYNFKSSHYLKYKNTKTAKNLLEKATIIKVDKQKLREHKKYFKQLYWKAKKFIEQNKNELFIKNQKICLQKLLEQEDDFLFNKKIEYS